MTKNPFLNSFAASVYIVLVVSLLNFTTMNKSTPDSDSASIIIPIMIISLFTLSAAVMAYVFCYQPLMLYLDGKKEQAVKLFLQTLGIFGCMTLLGFGLFIAGVFS